MNSQLELGFSDDTRGSLPKPARPLAPGALLLPGFALSTATALLDDVERISEIAPFRQMITPGGFRMSVAMTNCGAFGWVSSERGYRYDRLDPERELPWPELPASFLELAQAAASSAGFSAFEPDACLINRYAPGSRLTLHQDKDERDFDSPIVSVSLGLPAVFLFGGETRKIRPERVPVTHGDVVVWGGPSRLRYHGVAPIKDGHHERLGSFRLNLTLRRAG